MWRKQVPALCFLLVLTLMAPIKSSAYSVLTHQALIDASWDNQIQPLLQIKFPNATAEQLKEAHAYAYGGAIAPDMGYYPFGSKFFTHLTHYVRSGDFVMALIHESRTLNEYAFALGALCHYHADMYGHPVGTNPSVAVIYPKVRAAHGPKVTYAEDPIAHMRTEFGFDVLQTARGNYASKQYHDFIGFKVDTAVLERAFFQTYRLHVRDVFRNLPKALNAFRWSVAHFFPAITRTAWAAKKSDIQKLYPTATAQTFRYKMQGRLRNKEGGKAREKPTLGTTLVSFLIRVAPKIGPLRVLKFKAPSPEAEKLFVQSFDTVLVHYQQALKKVQADDLQLVNGDYDTGNKTLRGEYRLADETYDTYLLKLQEQGYAAITPGLQQHLLQFYGQPVKGKNAKQTTKLTNALQGLRQL